MAQGTKHKAQIAAVTPAPAHTNKPAKPAEKPRPAPPPVAKPAAPDTNIVWISKQRYIKKMSTGQSVTVIVDNPDEPKPIPVFESGLNNFITNFLEPGEDVPETPIEFTNEDVVNALMEKIEIKESDTDDVKFKKEAILLLREQLREYIKDGKSAQDFVADLQRRQQSEAAYVNEARGMVFDSLANDNIENARELYQALNKHMEEKGLPKIRLPKRILNKLEVEQK